MGCLTSKLGNEDTVLLCKERRGLMKEAIYARHQLAAAHSDYLRSLEQTGLALSAFAAGVPLSVADCSTASLTSNEDEMEHDNDEAADAGARSSSGPSPPPSVVGPKSKYSEAGSSSIKHRDLVGIVGSIKDCFDKAADAGARVSEMLPQRDPSGEQVSEMLPQLDPSIGEEVSEMLAQLDPSSGEEVSEMLAQLDPSGSEDSKICLLLDLLLALEEKLYREVKERGVFNIKRAKLSALQSQEHKGKDESKLNKTKASIKKLDSQILATSTAVSAFSTAIVIVQDAKLGPQLVKLCQGFVFMWKFMNQYHEVQNQVIQQVRGLVNRSTASTSDLHSQATRDLEAAVSAWHTSFCRLIKFQRDFIKSLHGWFKLTLLPINMEEAAITGSQTSDVYVVLDEWNLALERTSYTTTSEAASKAIESFINGVQLISSKQAEEMKVKKHTESASKELEKKASSLRSSIEKKYCHSNSMVGIGLPGSAQDDGHGLDARDPLLKKKGELEACQRRIEEEMVKHSKAVEATRARTLGIIQTDLSGVFQAMTNFSLSIMESLEAVCNKSKPSSSCTTRGL